MARRSVISDIAACSSELAELQPPAVAVGAVAAVPHVELLPSSRSPPRWVPTWTGVGALLLGGIDALAWWAW
jgi:hypothetical protein